MGKINFEENRQPWETGPHWELKREFMEKYQDDFPEDRLLCLAQAYSNIELLHCSYPDPVMLQIHELSKPLNGCRRFREATKNSSKDEPELQTRAAGKRSATDDLKKPFKFIKFYSAGNQSSEVAGSSTAEENTSTDAKKSDTFTEDSEAACDAMVPLDTISTNTPRQSSTTEDNTSVNVPKSNNKEDTAAFRVATPSVVQLDTNTTSTFKLSNSSTQNEDFILSLSQSPDLNLINSFSKGLSSLEKKLRKPLAKIKRLIDLLDFHGIAHYKFEEVASDKASVYLCKFFIKDTLISIGRGVQKHQSQISAAFNALETLEQFSNLPVVALSKLNCNAHKDNVHFLHTFLQEATKPKKPKPNREKLCSVEKIMSIIDSLQCPHEVSYFGREDLESSLGKPVFYVDVVINKVLICTGKNTKKVTARSAAADEILPLLQKFFKGHSESFPSVDLSSSSTSLEFPGAEINKDVTLVPSQAARKSDEQQSCTFNSKFLPQMKNDNSKPLLLMDPTVGTTCFKINHRILRNSIEKQFAVFDLSEVSSATQNDKPQIALLHSAQFCKKVVSFDVHINDTFTNCSNFKCDITFEGENIAVGEGSTKADAKTNASFAALKILKKNFYTIKVKSELDESFVIKRDQVINAQIASEAVSDSNVGCKMLKLMGWTGGGIGKTESGITEPITSSEYRFQRGLGFADKKAEKKFLRAIESVLKEFSLADTISDLVFSSCFTREERKTIHNASRRFGLVSSSKGANEKRQLFVKHKMSVTELINYLIRKNGCTPKYELVDEST